MSTAHISSYPLRTDYQPGEQPSASDINAAHDLLSSLVSFSEFVIFKHTANGKGIECSIDEQALVAAILKSIQINTSSSSAAPQTELRLESGDLQVRTRTRTVSINTDGKLTLTNGTWSDWTTILKLKYQNTVTVVTDIVVDAATNTIKKKTAPLSLAFESNELKLELGGESTTTVHTGATCDEGGS